MGDSLTAIEQDPLSILLEMLHEPDGILPETAKDCLKEISKSRSVPVLVELLHTDSDDTVRAKAAEALGLIGNSSAVAPLLSHITDPDFLVRTCVAEALGCVGKGDKRVPNALCCLLTDSEYLVRIFTLQALGDLGDTTALAAVRTRRDAEPPAVRVWVYYVLYRLGNEPFALTETIRILRVGTALNRTQAATVLAFVVTVETQTRIVCALERQLARETSAGMREHIGRRLEEARLPID